MRRWKHDDRGPKKRVHRPEGVGTVTYGWSGSLWRIHWRVNVYRHCFAETPDRWTLQPTISYDRRQQ